MGINPKEIDKITDIIFLFSTYKDRDALRKAVEEQLDNYTLMVDYDGNRINAVCRFNISQDGKTAHILDLIILHGDGTRYFKKLLLRGLSVWDNVETLTYEKGYDDGSVKKPIKKILVDKFLRREAWV